MTVLHEKSTHLDVKHGDETVRIAARLAKAHRPGGPGLIWLGGFRSDMMGSKAETMVTSAAAQGLASLRFDYSGHGESGGAFEDGTISRWATESLAAFETFTEGPQIVLGSSMGAWIALRLAQELQIKGAGDRLAALLLIAPAPDFTSALMEPAFSDEERAALAKHGRFERPTPYGDEPDVFTAALIEDGRQNLVLDSDFDPGVPVHILQGMADPDVPWRHALQLVESLATDAVSMTLVKDGDHRLSREADLALLRREIAALISRHCETSI